MTDKKVVIMRGVSGSGKSTFIKNHFPDAVVCSADKYYYDKNGNYNWDGSKVGSAHAFSRTCFKSALQCKKPLVVVDNTNTRLKEFKFYLTMADQHGYDVTVIRLEVPLEVLFGRNVHGVPDETVQAMYDRMEPFEGETVVV